MKNIFFLFILIFSVDLKSQSVTIDIIKSGFGENSNYYRKDLNNLLNPFEGSYIYTNGTSTFKIVLKKMIKQPVDSHYEDIIIGEYQYMENGIEKANTLSNLNIIYSDQFLKHGIAGNRVISKTNSRLWICTQCNTNEKRIGLNIRDISTNRYADILMRRTVINGQQVMQVKIYNVNTVSYNVDTESPPADFSLPLGEFIMIKQ
ncbi:MULTISPECIES: DUF6705 family protein [unclassified Chryseobacterium]|uniref:DUF6705 family protein n=1 Tax=unclassified Chryseobacterium TaxID=2593645 RepID=UPI001E3A9D77|nr:MULTISPECIES: DUF6705 family protein [unclassified Chryseobacterium]MCD0480768.1 hypothetical protein [Chryseobacterium sp. LC2016-29]MDY0933276.1 DUF6705 family protein [Chryseobacterium sp. CFBP8996]